MQLFDHLSLLPDHKRQGMEVTETESGKVAARGQEVEEMEELIKGTNAQLLHE